MLGRLGFAGRILTIVLLMGLAFVATGSAVTFFANTAEEGDTPSLPLPDQAAAIVGLLDALDDAGDAQLLTALNASRLKVRLTAERPPAAANSIRRPALEWLVERYSQTFGGRDLQLSVSEQDGHDYPRLRARISRLMGYRSIKLAVSLNSGGYAVFETRGLVTRFFGLPAGFFIGLIGALVGIAAIWAIISEARPLRRLVESVDRFAERAEPVPVTPTGAPEIKRLIRANNEMQSRISKFVSERTVFLGAISHDLKTFLTRFRLRIEEIPDQGQRQRGARDLDDMTRLLDDALAVAANMKTVQRRTSVDLAHLLSSDLADRASDKVVLDIAASGGWTVAGDKLALRRAFTNLIDNALTYGTRCEVALRRAGPMICVEIEDDGPGIPEAERERAFEPFYRADSSRSRATGGSGLGLAIAKQIVEAHGGVISIGQPHVGGARVRVELPASADNA